MPTQLLFSNNIESLARDAARNISRYNDFFHPAIIIVPNPYLKKWLQLKIAETNGIAINLNFRYLEDGLWDILNSINPQPEKPSPLGQIDLQLLIYHTLNLIDRNEVRIHSISMYLFNQDGTKKNDYEKKLFHLSGRLAQYFLEYEYSREEMILRWRDGNLLYGNEIESAQQYLYELIFKKNGLRDTIDKSVLTLPQYWNRMTFNDTGQYNLRVIFFGISHLSPLHSRIIYTLGKCIELTIYQVNPCSEFWEDVTSTREDRWQRIRSISINQNEEGEVLSENIDDNPLLKLWGQAGRETVKLLSLIEDAGGSELNFSSRWILPELIDKPPTILNTIQDLILKRRVELCSDEKLKQDKSIQVASCPDIFRETESVYNNILFNLSADKSLNMNDIAIMVPDMSRYGPVIHSVFSRNPILLSFSMIDSNAAIESIFGNAVLAIINIAMGTFTRNEIFKLFRNKYFMDAHKISIEDVSIWLHWVDALNIFHDFFKHDDIDPERNLYTWQQGLQRMRFGRILKSNEDSNDVLFLNFKHIIPYTDMYTNDEDRINDFTVIVELLFTRVKELKNANYTGSEWISIIEKIISDLLIIPDDNQNETNVYNGLISSIQKLHIMYTIRKDKEGIQLPLSFIKEYITENLINIPSASGGYLSRGINISALVPKRQIPFKIIYIMGMQEGIFPGSRDRSTLNLSTMKRHIGDVTRPDANRFLFLETLMATREKLYISYVSKDLQKDQDYYPNSVVGQLINYMDNYIIAENFKIVPIPISASSKYYLSMIETAFYSDFLISDNHEKFQAIVFNESDRLLIFHATYQWNSIKNTNIISTLNNKMHLRVPDLSFDQSVQTKEMKSVEISLRDLSFFLLNPVESTLRWHLALYDDNEDDLASRDIEPFYSINPFSYHIIINALNCYIRSDAKIDVRKYIGNFYRHSQRLSKTPSGAFSKIDVEKIIDDALNRIESHQGIAQFINSRENQTFYQNIMIGQTFIDTNPGLTFPAIHHQWNRDENKFLVKLNGSIPFLWKNKSTGECETLVITTSSAPKPGHIINSFLFYIISASGLDNRLKSLTGDGQFTIHISCKSEIKSYSFSVNEAEGKTYLDGLIYDFLDENSRDLLPLALITDNRLITPSEMKINASDIEKMEYHNILKQLIDDDAEKMFPSFRSTSMLQLFKPEVPIDAYDKARRRFSLPMQPFQRK